MKFPKTHSNPNLKYWGVSVERDEERVINAVIKKGYIPVPGLGAEFYINTLKYSNKLNAFSGMISLDKITGRMYINSSNNATALVEMIALSRLPKFRI